ncbi:MAG TPA: DotU family type IV/VI secretion system protein [Pyrinomonadaceae bacterium]|jgi:type VI secretion system protein ImpK|nr:DotU family type IV/VI secretion system protein [Pyrinomonadaceae bacterium]
MTASQPNESFLLGQFRDFYTEVIQLKELIKNSAGTSAEIVQATEPVAPMGNGNGNGDVKEVGNATGPLPRIDPVMLETLSGSEKITSLAVLGSVDTHSQPTAGQSKLALLVWQRLIDMFRKNAVQILRAAGKPTDNYFEAQYVMAAFADDVFIHLDWEGRRAWTRNLLETALFQSHVSGEMFFEKLDRLLRDRDPADKSLAAVYLNALSLGFRGKYQGLNDHGKLRRYRHELFAFIFRQPADLVNDSKIAFPDSYVQNLRKERNRKMTNPRVWLAVLGVVVFAYLAVSHGVWLKLTSRIEQANQQITDLEKRLDSLPPPMN